jgi:hypothetical protein
MKGCHVLPNNERVPRLSISAMQNWPTLPLFVGATGIIEEETRKTIAEFLHVLITVDKKQLWD